MTVTTTAPAPAPLSPPPPAPPSVAARVAGALRSGLAGTPGRMRLLMALTAVASVVFGFAAAQGFAEASGALERADANTAQLVRLQAVHTNLVRADADATNAFLRGGLESAEQRQDYLDAVTQASQLIADAARAQPADNAALAALNTAVIDYTGLIEQARANNRQGFPVGAQYLRNASTGLRAEALPLLENLVKANEDRVSQEFDGIGRGNTWLTLAGLVALVVIGASSVWLARRTRRYINVPVAIGGIAVLLTTLVGTTVLSNADERVDDVRDGAYASTLALAQARIAAYDAKSHESLTLIARGSGAAFEKSWQQASARVTERLGKAGGLTAEARPLLPSWTDYAGIHRSIRAADDNGRWDNAVELAIGTSGNTSNAAFGAFDRSSSTVLGHTVEQTRADLSDAGGALPLARWISLAAGLLAALCAWWGVSQRLEEYR